MAIDNSKYQQENSYNYRYRSCYCSQIKRFYLSVEEEREGEGKKRPGTSNEGNHDANLSIIKDDISE